MCRRNLLFWMALGVSVLGGVLGAVKTRSALLPVPRELAPGTGEVSKSRLLDRNGTPLTVTYQNRWNHHDFVPLHQMPPLLVAAFLESEDRRFFQHNGVDWAARVHALLQNAAAMRVVRGASTISEQVIRTLHPRPRTFWSRWLEGIEAQRLEQRFSKAEILEFYLNQVPYACRRRGVPQAARFYFDRSLDALDEGEILALAVLVRAPGRMDLRKRGDELKRSLSNLAGRLRKRGLLSEEQDRRVRGFWWVPPENTFPGDAPHFVQAVQKIGLHGFLDSSAEIVTTLDGVLQRKIQRILDVRLRDLSGSQPLDGAVLVVDHLRDEVLAWVNGGGLSEDLPGGWIDAVTVPRQPGSTLKPFLYALALERGWTAATLIEDTPLAEPIGTGLHPFRNYSRIHYGPLRLREALGNSLNVPAVRTVQHTGQGAFLETLRKLGFHSLNRPSDHYGSGLALGDGEVSLLELVGAYAVLGRLGERRPLSTVLNVGRPANPAERIFQEETAAIIGDILSDPQARRLEFGEGHLLRFPFQTAVKTGTSSDHKDAWAVGFSRRHTVGVWMGHLDRKPTRGITGATGPALVLRAVFAELNREGDPRPLSGSTRLAHVPICGESGLLAGPACPVVWELFKKGTAPTRYCSIHTHRSEEGKRTGREFLKSTQGMGFTLLQPTRDLQLRMDPHIPDALEAFVFLLPKDPGIGRIQWTVNGTEVGETGPGENRFLWPLVRGRHWVQARVWKTGSREPQTTPAVPFEVK